MNRINMALMRNRNQVIEEFIEIYKLEPCLWRVKSKDYHDRSKRDGAYANLVQKLKEIDPDAVKDTVVKKINNLRSNVRKEKKKFEASLKSGTSADDVYKPTLWYYDLFDFLQDQDTPRISISNLDDDEGNESNEENIEEESQQSLAGADNVNEVLIDNQGADLPTITSIVPEKINAEQHRTPTSRPNNNKKKKNDDLTTDVLMSVRNHFKKPQAQEDRYDHWGKTVVMKVRNLEKRQRLIAEHMINDILFEAEMGTLATPSSLRTPGYLEHYARNSFTCTSGSPSPNSYTPNTSPSPNYPESPFLLHSVHNDTIGQTEMMNIPQHSSSSSQDTAASFLSQYRDF